MTGKRALYRRKSCTKTPCSVLYLVGIYTVKEAIHDEAVLGFMVENLGAKDLSDDAAKKVYETEGHMRKVLNVILNQSYDKFGMKNGRGRTYEAILTTSSIAMAQKYYDLLKKV